LADIIFYLQALAVPARRSVLGPEIQRGETLFGQAGCSVCHLPELKTEGGAQMPSGAGGLVYPYTQPVLHRQGEAAARGGRDYEATGREWRTAPLWGIGLSPAINGHAELLHDGRARNVTEAILWHGGQAERSRDAFRGMPKRVRDAIVKFVESL